MDCYFYQADNRFKFSVVYGIGIVSCVRISGLDHGSANNKGFFVRVVIYSCRSFNDLDDHYTANKSSAY